MSLVVGKGFVSIPKMLDLNLILHMPTFLVIFFPLVNSPKITIVALGIKIESVKEVVR